MGIMGPVKKGFAVAGQSLNLVLTLFVFGVVWNLINLYMTTQLGPAGATPTTGCLRRHDRGWDSLCSREFLCPGGFSGIRL